MGICNKVAGAIAPVILAYYIFSDGDAFLKSLEGLDAMAKAEALDELAQRVIGPYGVMTIVLLLLGFLIRFAPLPEIETEQEENDPIPGTAGERKTIFQFPHLVLGAMALFFYVGVEVIAGDTIIRYGMAVGVPIESAQYFTSMVLFAMVIGYIIGIVLIPKVLSQRMMLTLSALTGIVFTMLAIFVPASGSMNFSFIDIMSFKTIELTLPYSVFFIALLGVSNAIVWPAIWPLAIHGLGDYIKTGSALLIMSIAGGAILPLIWGYLADVSSPQQAYWIGIPCYLFILFFAVYGYKVKRWSENGQTVVRK
jgi:fucose permease